jgi:nucleoside-diphosphate-sugar epimerase
MRYFAISERIRIAHIPDHEDGKEQDMAGTVLILGATGRFGRNMAEAFGAAGWTVRRFARGKDDLTAAARGADVIVNGWNPPYPRWQAELPGLTRQVIAAAEASGASVIVPGNVYVFGAEAPERFAEDTPHAARNRLGRLRVEMEEAYRASTAQVIVLRAGDFLDTGATGNWFDRVLAKDVGKGRFVYPGRTDVPHAWAFLPDMARAAVALAEKRGDLGPFEEVPFPGYTLTGAELHGAVERVMDRSLALKPMNWLPLRIARPFWPMAGGLLEMRYLWDKPHHLDGTKFARLLPGFEPTPVETALRAALQAEVDPDHVMAQRTGLA